MMTVQETTAEIAPGETAILTPVTVCIDSGASIPEAGDNYTMGEMESGELLQLARCVCASPDTLNDPMGVQFAVWQVSNPDDGDNIDAFNGEAMQALIGEAMGEDIPAEMLEMLEGLEGVMDIPGLNNAAAWLEKCDIE